MSRVLHRKSKSEEEVLWEDVLADLRLHMTRASFDRWLRASRLLELQRREEGDALLVVEVTTPYAADWLENRLKPVIRRTVEARLRHRAELAFKPRTVGTR